MEVEIEIVWERETDWVGESRRDREKEEKEEKGKESCWNPYLESYEAWTCELLKEPKR